MRTVTRRTLAALLTLANAVTATVPAAQPAVAMPQPAWAVSQPALAVPQPALAVSQRVWAVPQPALAVSQRVWAVSQPALAMSQPAATVQPASTGPWAVTPAYSIGVSKTPGRIAADPIAHDPTVIKQGKYYYSFITGTYLPMRRSTDLLHWDDLGSVFSTPPAWIAATIGVTPGDLWAPDISYFDGLYHLYYAGSQFGTNNSVIGLATTPTLDPPAWTDRGLVLRSTPADDFNAIDPDLSFDARGQAWLAFGSFWDGIKMREIDRTSGMPSPKDATLYSLASRGGASIEGASIAHRGAYYYLFASFDYCCRGIDSDYRTIVGRATSITGPYTDRSGTPMLQGGGTELLRGYNEFRGTGGGDVFGDLYVHHYYDLDDNGAPKLSVRPIVWSGGWPSLGDPLSGSRSPGHGPAYVELVSRVDGSVIADAGCGYEGADIVLETPSGSPCQQWRPDPRGDGYVSLGNRFSNKVAEVAACVDADGARVAQWGWLDNNCQMFRFDASDAGWVRVESRLNTRVLQAAGAGSPVQTWTAASAPAQQFRIQPVGDVLMPAIPGLWRFTHVRDGYYRVVDRRTGRQLGNTLWRIAPGALIAENGRTLTTDLDTP